MRSLNDRRVSEEIATLLDEMEEDLDRGVVPLRIFGDAEIWQLELRRVFARCWIFVAHESEIPHAGDYVARAIADTAVIVTRDDAGAIHVMWDSCRHRGVKLCRADKGNTAQFVCPYHGWTYRSDGTLVGIPNRADGYGTSIQPEEWGLLQIRTASYQGLIFACFDSKAPTLEEYLGDFRWYLDVHFGLAPERLEVIGTPLRWIIPGNWKTGSENFAGDSYHTAMLHRSVSLAEIAPPLQQQSPYNVHVTECSGHATSMSRAGEGVRNYWGAGPSFERHYRESVLSPEQLDLARRSINSAGTVFPNFGFVHNSGSDAKGATPSIALTISVLQPKSPTTIEMLRWVLVPKGATEAEKQRSHQVAFANHGTIGMIEQDDSAVWAGAARSGASTVAQVLNPKVNYGMGIPGETIAKVVTDWPGPGIVLDSRLEDGTMKTIYRNWLKYMRTP